MDSTADMATLIPTSLGGFPSERQAEEPNGCLLLAYVWFVFRHVPSVWWRTLLIFFLEQLYCAWYLMVVYMCVYISDVVLNVNGETTMEQLLVQGSRSNTLWACAAIFTVSGLVLLLVWLLCDWLKEMVFCAIAEYHHAQLLQVAASSRISSSEAALSIPTIVEKGYLTFFTLLVLCGFTMVVGCFITRQRPESVVVLCLFLVLVFCLIVGCGPNHDRLVSADTEAAGSVVRVSNAMPAVSRGEHGAAVQDGIEKFEALCKARYALRRFRRCSIPLLWAPTVLAVAWYETYGALQVLEGRIDLQTYINSQSDFFVVGLLFYLIHTTFCKRAEAEIPLIELMDVLNAHTDVDEQR